MYHRAAVSYDIYTNLKHQNKKVRHALENKFILPTSINAKYFSHESASGSEQSHAVNDDSRGENSDTRARNRIKE